jgi:two-component system chemotaxis response regulator CheB
VRARAEQSAGAAPVAPILRAPLLSTEKLIIVGASTGGTEAIKEFLMPLPPDSPAVMIVQHMPAGFTKSFAQRLNGLCRITVKEAEHGERVLPGYAYIAPGDSHLLLARSGATTWRTCPRKRRSIATDRRSMCCSIPPPFTVARTSRA